MAERLLNDEPSHNIIIGPCSITEDVDAIKVDAVSLRALRSVFPKLMLIRRLNFWKPRTNPADWHGLETTNPDLAFRIIHDSVREGDSVAAEIGLPEHIRRFEPLLTFGWIGSRAAGNTAFIEQVLHQAPNMPLGVKNNMDGDIQHLIGLTNHLRQERRSDAPIIPIFRGGGTLRTPKEWAEAFKEMSVKTAGRFICDVAHGSEMAHDPSGQFKKTVEGQLTAIAHVRELLKQGFPMHSIMTEASNIKSPTDPNIPLNILLNEEHS